ncbi:MAG: helix-turn-helix transcriptional regulator [bacterium]|nr:helix-turn-helix transcriptional regulator [bacterium]
MRAPVVGLAERYAAGATIPRHRHPVGQLVFAASGVMTVGTPAGTWVVPPLRAVWLPPRTVHGIRMIGTVAVRMVYVAPSHAGGLPGAPCVVQVSPLLRECILRLMELPASRPADGPAARLVAVLLDEIRAAPVSPLHLPRPADPRARRLVRALEADPSDRRPLAAWARTTGASTRTLARLFQRETGLGFRAWRQQLRLLRGLERLAAGEPVTRVALDVGYDSPSAFVAAFRRALGTSPGRYFAGRAP